MNEMSSFSERAENAQAAFFSLSEDFKNQIIERAHGEAHQIQELIRSGQAGSYEEAVNLLPSMMPEHQKMAMKLETKGHGDVLVTANSKGDYFLHSDGNDPLFLGNASEGVYSEVSGMLGVDIAQIDKNMVEIFSRINLFVEEPQGNA